MDIKKNEEPYHDHFNKFSLWKYQGAYVLRIQRIHWLGASMAFVAKLNIPLENMYIASQTTHTYIMYKIEWVFVHSISKNPPLTHSLLSARLSDYKIHHHFDFKIHCCPVLCSLFLSVLLFQRAYSFILCVDFLLNKCPICCELVASFFVMPVRAHAHARSSAC